MSAGHEQDWTSIRPNTRVDHRHVDRALWKPRAGRSYNEGPLRHILSRDIVGDVDDAGVGRIPNIAALMAATNPSRRPKSEVSVMTGADIQRQQTR